MCVCKLKEPISVGQIETFKEMLPKNAYALRIDRGATLREVATKARMSATQLWEIEKGTSVNPKMTTLYNLASVLGVTVDCLVGLPEAENE